MPSADLPELPDPFPEHAWDAVQRTLDALSGMNALPAVLDSIDTLAIERFAEYSASLSSSAERMARESLLAVSEALDAIVVPWQEQAHTAAEALTRIDFSFDTTGLDRLLDGLQAWHTLDAEQRAATARVLEESFHSAEAGQAQQVPDDLVADLCDSAREFAAARDGLISPEAQRQLFMYFCGLVVLLALLQASFTSETADALIEKTIALSPAFVLAMAASAKAWDKYVRRPEQDGEEEDGGE